MPAETYDPPLKAYLHLNSWAGRTAAEVQVIGETTQRYWITCTERIRVAGRQRHLEAGGLMMVPKAAVAFDDRPTLDRQGGAHCPRCLHVVATEVPNQGLTGIGRVRCCKCGWRQTVTTIGETPCSK